MVFSSDGKYLFTSDNGVMDMREKGQGWNTVSIIDVKAKRRVGQIDLGEHRRPHGIDFDRGDGSCWSRPNCRARSWFSSPVMQNITRL